MTKPLLLIGILVISIFALVFSVLSFYETQNLSDYYKFQFSQKELIIAIFTDRFSEYSYTIQKDSITNQPTQFLSIISDGTTAELVIEHERIVFNCYKDHDTYLVSIVNPHPEDIVCHKNRF